MPSSTKHLGQLVGMKFGKGPDGHGGYPADHQVAQQRRPAVSWAELGKASPAG